MKMLSAVFGVVLLAGCGPAIRWNGIFQGDLSGEQACDNGSPPPGGTASVSTITIAITDTGESTAQGTATVSGKDFKSNPFPFIARKASSEADTLSVISGTDTQLSPNSYASLIYRVSGGTLVIDAVNRVVTASRLAIAFKGNESKCPTGTVSLNGTLIKQATP